MKRIFKHTMVLALALTVLSCSDDHFDINSSVADRPTLWEAISNNAELSDFADILDNVYYSKSEGSQTKVKYSELLSHDQNFTVWAPKNNDTILAKYKSMLATDPYTVEKELVQNHIVRYSKIMNGSESEVLDLFNSKTALFDPANMQMGAKHVSDANIGCSNGILHVLDGVIEYKPNLYEYISKDTTLSELNSFLKEYEMLRFDEANSTQGPTVNGNITWVDSVVNMTNDYFSMMDAYLNKEDSIYAMVLPNNNAWEDAIGITSKYFKYMKTYNQKVVTVNSEGDETTTPLDKTFTDEELDSMSNLFSKSAICQNLVFNAKYQAKPFNIDKPADCDSLVSTNGRVFEQPQVAQIFGDAVPVELSNGYAYVVDTFAYRGIDTWAKKRDLEAEMSSNIESNVRCNMANTQCSFVMPDTVVKYTVARAVQTTPTANPEITFKLPNIMSCKYDIYVVMAYNTNANMSTKFKATLTYHEGKRSTQSNATLKPEADDIHKGASNTYVNLPCPYVDDNGVTQYVDSICVAHDFEFPVAYYGTDFYPTLKLSVNVTSKEISTYTREMWIDQIVLVAKE